MLKSALIFMLTLGPVGWSAKLVDVKNYQEEGRFVSELIFDGPIASDSLEVDFINETVQVDVPGATVPGGKLHRSVDDPMVRSTFTYQVDPKTLRNRIIYKGVPADSFAEEVELASSQNSLKIFIGEKIASTAPMSTQAGHVLQAAAPPKKLGSMSSERQIARAGESQAKNTSKKIEADVVGEADLQAHKEEESIPLLLNHAEEKEATANPFFKMIASLGIIAIFGILALIVLKRWRKNAPLAGSNTQIKVLTQHHLGAKRSLAIIRVAGESILIGITDHNISMIKSLSLLDEDIPDETPEDFGGVLGKLWERDTKVKKSKSNSERKKSKKAKSESDDDFSIEGIRDIVSSRLKDMRSID